MASYSLANCDRTFEIKKGKYKGKYLTLVNKGNCYGEPRIHDRDVNPKGKNHKHRCCALYRAYQYYYGSVGPNSSLTHFLKRFGITLDDIAKKGTRIQNLKFQHTILTTEDYKIKFHSFGVRGMTNSDGSWDLFVNIRRLSLVDGKIYGLALRKDALGFHTYIQCRFYINYETNEKKYKFRILSAIHQFKAKVPEFSREYESFGECMDIVYATLKTFGLIQLPKF